MVYGTRHTTYSGPGRGSLERREEGSGRRETKNERTVETTSGFGTGDESCDGIRGSRSKV